MKARKLIKRNAVFSGFKLPEGMEFIVNGECKKGDFVIYRDNGEEKAYGYIGNRIINGIPMNNSNWRCARKI